MKHRTSLERTTEEVNDMFDIMVEPLEDMVVPKLIYFFATTGCWTIQNTETGEILTIQGPGQRR